MVPFETYPAIDPSTIEIVAVGELPCEPYYDFHVPVHLNYWAAGVWNHNSGKTTLLECLGPAVFFRELPTREPSGIQNWIGPKGGRIELDFVRGSRRYEAIVEIDGSGRQAAFLTCDGVKLASGKVRDYDVEIAKVVGNRDAFYASVFGMQGGGGRFESLEVTDRKAIFRYYLGLDRVDKAHRAARARLEALDVSKIATLRADLEACETAIAEAEADVKAAVFAADAEREVSRKARAKLDDLLALSSTAELVDAYDTALDAAGEAQDALTALPARPAAAPAPTGDKGAATIALEAARKKNEGYLVKSAEIARVGSSLATANADLVRANKATERLARVPCKGEGAFAGCELLRDAIAARESIAALRDVCAKAEQAHETLKVEVAALVVPREKLDALRAKVAEAERELEAHRLGAERCRAYDEKRDRLNRALADAKRQAAALRARLPKVIDDVPSLAQIDAAREASAAASAAYEKAIREHEAGVAAFGGALDRKAGIEKALAAEEARAADAPALELLARALGANGIQAYEIDAAGPRVSALANSLLHACYGPRFDVEVRTTKALKSGKGEKEDFDVVVYDNDSGIENTIAGLSGGEKVIVDEALRLSLVIFADERLSVPFRVLYRDETIGGLTRDNRAAYARMLHRARDLGDFGQIFQVTHDEESSESADVVIAIDESGNVSVA